MNHTAKDRTPYTYLIKFNDGRIYYGVRYARGCHSSELGVSYFSSSRSVHTHIKVHGVKTLTFEPRVIFKSASKAKRCETRVLQKFNARSNQAFVNRHNNDSFYPVDNSGSKNPMYGSVGTMTGRHHSKEAKEKISKAMIGKFIGRNLTDDVNKRIHDAQRGYKSFRFTGYYHTPHGVFGSSREAALSNLSYKTIQLWCKNSNNIISKRSPYFKEEHLGKTLKEIGFWFQSL
jgi:hypothetical protein